MRILHVITGLGTGGAETALVQLIEGTRDAAAHAVVALGAGGPLARRLSSLVDVQVLNTGSERSTLASWRALRRYVSDFRADVLQGWMYHGNVAAALVAGRRPILWSIRQSLPSITDERPGTRAMIRIGAVLSRRPHAIIYNSRLSAVQHEAIGFSSRARTIVRNGFDAERFRPDPQARARIRHELGIAHTATVVCHVARAHPVKDHAGFATAVVPLLARNSSVHVLLAGRGIDPGHEAIAGLFVHASTRVHALGERSDIPQLLAASDILCLSSRAEGFPNVVGEAMASGLPIVTTAVGDVAELVGTEGYLTPPGDPAALTTALETLIAMDPSERAALGLRLRRRVRECFSLGTVRQRFIDLWNDASNRMRRVPDPA